MEQRYIVIPGEEIREWVLIDHTAHLIEEPKKIILGQEAMFWVPLIFSTLSFVIACSTYIQVEQLQAPAAPGPAAPR